MPKGSESSSEMRAKLCANFKFIGYTPEEEILAQCEKLCAKYNLDEEELVDQWAAFSLNRMKNAPPSVNGLKQMEMKELAKHTKPKPENKRFSEVPDPDGELAIPQQKAPPQAPKITREHVIEDLNLDISTSSQAVVVDQFSKRLDSGKVVESFGRNKKYSPCSAPVFVSPYPPSSANAFKFMYNTTTRIRTDIADVTENIANCIARKYGITLPEDFTKENAEKYIHLYGRIVCDGDGKINNSSVLLELPKNIANGACIPLNLMQLKNYSLFPGQVVITEGKIMKGVLHVEKLFTSASQIPKPVKLLEPLQIIAASGPFTLKTNLSYEPLQELLKYVVENKPHVLILIGPFLDVENEMVIDGAIGDTYYQFFETLVESIMRPLKGYPTTVVFVASAKDVSHWGIYPTVPFDIKQNYENLICVSDPCLLDINGVIVGVTATDSLFHIARQEMCWPGGQSDRMSRLSQYLLDQKQFYPLYPVEENSMFMDYEYFKQFCVMEQTPNILILPSIFRYFIKQINECTVINQERLVKGYSGGTFAKIGVQGGEKLDISCEIIKV